MDFEEFKRLLDEKFPTDQSDRLSAAIDELFQFRIWKTPAKPFNRPEIKRQEDPDPNYFFEYMQWIKVLKHPSVIEILGGRGWGKSAGGYRFLEYLHYQADIFVVGLPRKARSILPAWIGSVPTIEDLPSNSIALIDEAYGMFHARTSTSERSRMLSNIINLSRQRGQSLIFVSQEGRQLDKNISSSANVIVFKNPNIMQFEFERKELRKLAEDAKRMFAPIADKDKPRWSYIFAPEINFAGMLENSLPSFWVPSLSKAYGDSIVIDEIKIPSKMTRQEKIIKAKELKRLGWSDSRIADYLGVSKATVHNWIHDYPYRR